MSKSPGAQYGVPGLSTKAVDDLETVIARHSLTETDVLAVLARMAEPAEPESAAEASMRRAALRKGKS